MKSVPEIENYPLIGKGDHGAVYISPEDSTLYKIVFNEEDGSLKKEYSISKIMAETGITPQPLEVDYKSKILHLERAKGFPLKYHLKSSISFTPHLKRILNLMETCYGQGVSHNDLHLGNVFIDPVTNSLSLIDWGMATRKCSWRRKCKELHKVLNLEKVKEEYPHLLDLTPEVLSKASSIREVIQKAKSGYKSVYLHCLKECKTLLYSL